MLFCCLWRNVETYCKHFAVLSHRQQTPPLTTSEVSQHACVTYVVRRRRIYNLTGSSVNSSEAIYWFRIAVSAYPTCIRRPHRGVPVGILLCRLVWKN